LIQDPLAVKILEGEFKEGDRIKNDSAGDEMVKVFKSKKDNRQQSKEILRRELRESLRPKSS
jgi:hypothetical protein